MEKPKTTPPKTAHFGLFLAPFGPKTSKKIFPKDCLSQF